MITKTVYKNREEWLEYRKGSPMMGSSDVGTILGLNPYCTPYQFWVNYHTQAAQEQSNDSVLRGQYKEDAIARLFAAKTGERIIKRSAEIEVYHNDKYPDYVQVAPDRMLFARGRRTRGIVEIKDTRMPIVAVDKENTPKMWYCQLMYQMGVMELDWGYLGIENGIKELVYGLFDFDAETQGYIMAYCCEWFERYILGTDIPPVETGEDARLAWPVAEDKIRLIGAETMQQIRTLKEQKRQRKELDEKIKKTEDDLRIFFEDYTALEYEGNIVATYRGAEDKPRKLLLK